MQDSFPSERLTFSSNSFPEGFGICHLIRIVLCNALVHPDLKGLLREHGYQSCHATYLEMIDMNVETTPPTLIKRMREFLIGFT
jgi:hypothetical protein